MKQFLYAAGLLTLFGSAQVASGQSAAASKASQKASVDKEWVSVATQFLNSLNNELRAQATYPFTDEERFNWGFVPRARKGVPLKSLNEAQQKAAMAVLRMGLSEQGYSKATAIIDLENVLRVVENRGSNDTYRDPTNYYFTIFGTPSTEQPWAWRIEGHHLAFNFSSISRELTASTPSFMGSNPGIVRTGPQAGKQVLKQEADVAYALLQSFTPDQLKKALISEKSPEEILTSNNRKAMIENPEGILLSEMNAEQKNTFRQLLDTYLNNYHKTLAAYQQGKIKKAGLEKFRFAWAGSTDRSTAHYYRIHGPTLLIEFANVQNNANHVHTSVRDLNNDFGEDFLAEHYKQQPHNK